MKDFHAISIEIKKLAFGDNCFHNASLNVLQVSLCAAEEMSHTRVTVFPFNNYNVVRRSSLVNVIFSQPTWNRVTVKIVHAFII